LNAAAGSVVGGHGWQLATVTTESWMEMLLAAHGWQLDNIRQPQLTLWQLDIIRQPQLTLWQLDNIRQPQLTLWQLNCSIRDILLHT